MGKKGGMGRRERHTNILNGILNGWNFSAYIENLQHTNVWESTVLWGGKEEEEEIKEKNK